MLKIPDIYKLTSNGAAVLQYILFRFFFKYDRVKQSFSLSAILPALYPPCGKQRFEYAAANGVSERIICKSVSDKIGTGKHINKKIGHEKGLQES